MKQNGTSSTTSRRLQDLEVLYRISNIINTTQESRKVLKGVLKEVVRLTGATSGSIALLDERQGVLSIETAINIPAQTWKRLKLQLGVGVTGWAAYKGEPVRVDNVHADSHYVAVKPDIKSELAVPMMLKGRVIGVINVDSTQRGAFTEDDERLLTAVAEQSARVLETARLYGRTRRHAGQLESLFAISRRLISPAPAESVMRLAAEEAHRLLNADAAAVVVVNEDGTQMEVRATSGKLDGLEKCAPMRVTQSLLAPVAKRGRPMNVAQLARRRAIWHGEPPPLSRMASLLAAPVVYQEQTQAVILVLSEKERVFSESESSLLQILANQVAVALENARRLDRLTAMEDNLHRAERFSLLGTLAAEIAHEIRNPVTIISLMLDSVREETEKNEQVQNDLGLIREKLDRIERIIDQTLNMARDHDPERESTDVNRLVGDLLQLMHYKFAKAGVEVRRKLAPDLPVLQVDQGQLQQVLLNLIINALQAMPEGGRLTLKTERVTDQELGEAVSVTVHDSGGGITREDLEHLFEPFFTTREEGTGLGLFISRRLVRAHQGRLRVQTRRRRGSTFTVVLPVSAAAEPANTTH